MAVQKVDYEDKIGLQNDPNTPNKNKVTDEDMNQLKSKINNNADELNEAQENIENLQQGQGTVSGDIASLKNRVSTLELDNTRNKQDIANKVDKVDGKGLSTEDFTTGLKAKLEGLSNYNDTEIKEDIQDIKLEQTTQNTKLQELEDNQMHITTERASNLNVQDASGQNAKIKLFGISKQEGTPSSKSPSEIENTTGNVKITSCNKNLANLEIASSQINVTTEKINANTFKVTRTSNTGASYAQIEMNLKKNKTYTVYVKITGSNTNGAAVGLWKGYHANGIYVASVTNYATIQTTQELLILALYPNQAANTNLSGLETTFEIMIIEGNNTNEEFVAHEQQATTFSLSQNQKMFEGSYLANDGIHHRRKQIEFDGTEDWIYYSANDIWARPYLLINDKKIGESNDTANVLCNKAKSISWNEMSKGINEYSVFSYSGDRRISISVKKEDLETQDEAGVKKYFQENNMIVEYNLEEETIEAYTEEQQAAHNQLQNAKTYKTVTNVFTDNAEVEMNYIADTKTYVDNEINSIKNQLNTINELLSTTTTSAMLLDNMQTDLESEVL